MLRRLGLPQGKVISVDQLKAHLRIDTADDDGLLASYIEAATATVEDRTGLILTPAVFRASVAAWSAILAVPAFPLRAITSVKYIDRSGAEIAIDADLYEPVETDEGFDIRFRSAFSAPALGDVAYPVIVRFEAGYDAGDPVPDPVLLPPDPRDRQMIIMLVGHWHKQVEATGTADLQSVPLGFEMLAAQRRIYR